MGRENAQKEITELLALRWNWRVIETKNLGVAEGRWEEREVTVGSLSEGGEREGKKAQLMTSTLLACCLLSSSLPNANVVTANGQKF